MGGDCPKYRIISPPNSYILYFITKTYFFEFNYKHNTYNIEEMHIIDFVHISILILGFISSIGCHPVPATLKNKMHTQQ